MPRAEFDRRVAEIGLHLPAAARPDMHDAAERLGGLVALLRDGSRPADAEGLAGWTPPVPGKAGR
jgi:hypothetical protein